MTRVALNIADLFEHTVDAAPGRPALKVGDRVLTFAELEADANRLAHYLSSRGVGAGEHVALYARNSIEHVAALLAVLKIRAVSVNVNYRYVEGELDYLFDNADVVALIHERCYAPLVARCAPKHEKLRAFVTLPDVTDPHNDADVSAFGGVLYADALEGQSPERDFGPRSGDDLHVIYTGGTTGFPKGVMWRQEDFWRVLGGGLDFSSGAPLSEYDQSEQAKQDGRLVTFPLSPLMHGGAQTGLLLHLFAGHLTILEPKFDAARTWDIVERDGVQLLFMTGDAMARPLIEEFERKAATGRPYEASSLFAISSTAAIFSPSVKERWLQAFPNSVLTDSIGATETGFQGLGLQDKGNIKQDGALVTLGPNSVVIDDDNRVLDRLATSAPWASLVAPAMSLWATTKTRRSPRRPSCLSTAPATRSPETGQGSRPMARSLFSGAGRTASIPVARRSIPKKSRPRSRLIPRSTTASSSASPTKSTARQWPPWSNSGTASASNSRRCGRSCAPACRDTSSQEP